MSSLFIFQKPNLYLQFLLLQIYALDAPPTHIFIDPHPQFFTRTEKDSIITLASDLEAAAFDHEFMSPTYREKLQRQIVNYIETRGQIL